jgi:hypothetical protein
MQANTLLKNEIMPCLCHRLGVVTIAVAGKAKMLSVYGQLLKVYAQASHLYLHSGDTILFIATEKGPFLLAKQLHANELPTIGFEQQTDRLRLGFNNNEIIITANGEIHLSNNNATITINASGSIQIIGKSIQQQSQTNIELSAQQHIHLNTRG